MVRITNSIGHQIELEHPLGSLHYLYSLTDPSVTERILLLTYFTGIYLLLLTLLGFIEFYCYILIIFEKNFELKNNALHFQILIAAVAGFE